MPHVILRNAQGRVQFSTDIPDDRPTTLYYAGEPIVVVEPDVHVIEDGVVVL